MTMNVEVFKFGGASVFDAESIQKVAGILELSRGKSMMLVLSAFGKTTNAMERILGHYMEKDSVSMVEAYQRLKEYHWEIIDNLFADKTLKVFDEVEDLFEKLQNILRQELTVGYDEAYDRVVRFGELLSTTILHHYLLYTGYDNRLFDAVSLIHTDSTFRDARVDWNKTQVAMQRQLFTYFQEKKGRIGLTQGFIGVDPAGRPTTLGREGSDFSAAIIGYCMRVKEVTTTRMPGA